eukprot:scaffold170462_cov36-Prasinocladus_malaysianus.AAC.1
MSRFANVDGMLYDWPHLQEVTRNASLTSESLWNHQKRAPASPHGLAWDPLLRCRALQPSTGKRKHGEAAPIEFNSQETGIIAPMATRG